ncbi:hypothetical protein PV327_010263 [Microctonus hyperodae]|uniref:Peptidase M12B domain-containing protein n=1 Tax=Microctonus hyperodae TaxID=165561 RepID=A0AA39FRX3_MICHY|nr:hypothetical protein PV327_010263 [Microctonus hyperodae]
MMKIIILILISEFVFLHGFDSDSSPTDSNPNPPIDDAGTSHDQLIPLPNLEMKIMSENDDSIISNVNLKLTERSLANENLPIWILEGVIDSNNLKDTYASGLVRNNEVMKQLGKFSIYQQPETSSAAVYFHKRRQFDGMIGYDILIRRLPMDVINSEGETNRQIGSHGIYRRLNYQGHSDVELDLQDKYVNLHCQSYKLTYQGRLYDGYPEILVVVSWDVAQDWTKLIIDESDRYTTIVSYVITLFNGIDMLYSKLKETKVQINIAGIIIGTKKMSFAFLDECRHTWVDGNVVENKMDAYCANRKIISFMKARQHEISLDSYDVVVLLTRQGLFYMKNGGRFDYESKHYVVLDGLALFTEEIFKQKIRNKDMILAATLVDYGYFHNYPTIAHELGHSMSLKHDDPPFFTSNAECCGNILKPLAEHCNECLSWSKTSEKTFKLFYGSSNCCSFINKPRSLLPPGRHRMLTAEEQCQCYGYKKSVELKELRPEFCRTNLHCIGTNNKNYRATVPMDGTPHGIDNKVCWGKMSQPIEIF